MNFLGRAAVLLIFGCAFIGMLSGTAFGLYNSDDLYIGGKFEAKTAFFTEDAQGNTSPKFSSGNMFKERNLLYLQADHNLKNLTGIDLQYHLLGRLLYEGVYDYGPKVYREVYDDNKDYFDDLRFDADLWEAYVTVTAGPVFSRIGRQNLSWGEADVIRVLDNINPLDNTWGGTGQEAPNDRRIPLWMARLNYQPLQTVSIETFWVPGDLDNQVSPAIPSGSPYAYPTPASTKIPGITWSKYFEKPDREMSNSRYGLKLSTMTENGMYALVYERTYLDSACTRFVTSKADVSPLNPGTVTIEQSFEPVHVFGFTANYYIESVDLILKTDVAHVLDQPVSIQALNMPVKMVGGVLPVFNTGEKTFRDFTNFMVAGEKKFWARAINARERLSFQYEYYGFYCHNHDEKQVTYIVDPDTGKYPEQKQYEQLMDVTLSSSWRDTWKVSFLAIYNPRGSWMIKPAVQYKFNCPVTLDLEYVTYFGNWVIPFGYANDRDYVGLQLRYEF